MRAGTSGGEKTRTAKKHARGLFISASETRHGSDVTNVQPRRTRSWPRGRQVHERAPIEFAADRRSGAFCFCGLMLICRSGFIPIGREMLFRGREAPIHREGHQLVWWI